MYKLFNFYSQSLFSSLLTPTITLPLLLYTLLFMFNYLRLLKFTMLFYAFFFSLLLFLKDLHLLSSWQCKQLPTSIFNISQFPIPNFSKKEPNIPSLVPVLISIIETIIFIFIFICLEYTH